MSRKPVSRTPRRVAVTARCEQADLDPRMVVVDPTFAATLTTRHTRTFAVAPGRSEAGVEELTRDVPNVDEEALEHLDADGLAIPGTPVRPGTILVGKVTPRGGGPSSPEEKLLLALFGEDAEVGRDTSLRAPPRCFGAVASARRDGERAEVVVAWDRPLAIGDVLIVDDERLTVAQIRPLGADLARAGGSGEVSVIKDAMARDALIARGIGPYDAPYEQPSRDPGGLAGQVVTSEAIAALAGAAPWAAFELLTVKADSVQARARLYESLVKGERPDVTPRTVGPGRQVSGRPLAGDIFSFFEPEPGPAPDEAAALQPEVVTVLALYLRALGLEVDLRMREVGVTLLSTEQIRERSSGEVRGPDELGSQRVFGPVTDYACECGKYTRMRDRGVVCEDCGVEVISSRVRRERCGHVELAAPYVHPLLAARRRGSARDEQLVEADAPTLTTLVVLPPALRGSALDAAYARVLTADVDALQAAVDELFAAIADIVDAAHPRMYSKAVDYSGAAPLVVDSSLGPGECRASHALLRELFRPQASGLLQLRGHAISIAGARRMVELEQPAGLAAIVEASEGYPVLLIAGARIVGRRVIGWDAPAIAVDRSTADALAARVVTLHVPVSHEAALAVAGLGDLPRARAPRSEGWLARARRDGELVAAAVRAAVSGERDPVDDLVVHIALGRAPEPVDERELAAWAAAEEARQQQLHDSHAGVRVDEPDPDPLARRVDELEVSVRTAVGLDRLGVVTLRDLCSRSEAELLRGGMLGRKSIKEIKEVLGDFGLTLAPSAE